MNPVIIKNEMHLHNLYDVTAFSCILQSRFQKKKGPREPKSEGGNQSFTLSKSDGFDHHLCLPCSSNENTNKYMLENKKLIKALRVWPRALGVGTSDDEDKGCERVN